MKGEKEIRELLELMTKRYEQGGTALDGVIMPADAYECANTLSWVLGESSGIDETLDQAGIDLATVKGE